MRIAHLFPKFHENVGDHLVQRGIRQLLREHLGDYEYTPLSTRRPGPDVSEPRGITRESVELLNRHDLLVIGGSNLYEVAAGHWGVEVEREALQRLTVPVLLLGIGAGWSFAFPRFPTLPPAVVEDLLELHRKAVGSSVRDSLTARVLAAHGIDGATLTGCPAGYLAEEPLRPVRGRVVGVPFLPQRMFAGPGLDPRRWRNPTQARRREATRFFRGLLEALAADGYEARLLVHDAADLDLARRIAAGAFFYSDRPEDLLEAIGQCDVIVGFRLHACIAALGLGIPSIPVLLDGRNDAFAETYGMTEHAVPLEKASVAMTLERVRLAMGTGRKYWEPVFARRDALREAMRVFLAAALVPGRAIGAAS